MKRLLFWRLLILIIVWSPLFLWNLPMRAASQGAQGRGASLAFRQNISGQTRISSSTPVFENYDIRTDSSEDSGTKLTRQRQRHSPQQNARNRAQAQSMRDAQSALALLIPDADITPNPLTGGPEIVSARPGSSRLLTAASDQPRDLIVRSFLARSAAVYGLSSAQTGQLLTIADYANPAGNLAWVTLEQRFNGLPVFAGQLRASLTPQGEVVRTVNGLAAGIVESELVTKPEISAADAVARAAASIGVTLAPGSLVVKSASPDGHQVVFERGPFDEEIKAELAYFPLEVGLANLAWVMTLWQAKPAYYTVVDAESGDLFYRKNITQDQTQTATYSIYNDDSPGPLSPSNATPGSGIQGAGISRTTLTFISELPAFDNLGWITDGGNTTTGNNVDAGLDIDGTDGIDAAGRATGSPSRVFNFAYNPPPLGADVPTGSNYRMGIVTDLFFWSNRYHDLLYTYGFTEPAGNFQNNNFGRGGLGSDFVRAQAQDSSGTNNANFSTPPDGSLPRMQMFIFNAPTPDRDGDLDHDVVLHELTHGTSNRLHGNATGLTGTQAGGMGEGWSDFYARALLSSAGEDVNGVYAAAAYVTINLSGIGTNNYYYGIRRFPYAVKTNLGANGKPHNPLTFADIDPSQINLLDGAFAPAFDVSASEVHNIGEVWCMALLEVRARLITRLGYAAGNQRALQIVTDGMKLDPSNPTMLQARDSILLADCAGFGGSDEADIWAGFATRGMGFSATINGGAYVTEAFDAPNLGLGNVTFSDVTCNNNGFADPGENLTLTVPLRNPFCSTNVTSVTASVVGGGMASYGTINAGTTVSQGISFAVPGGAQCGSLLTVTVNLNSSLGAATRTITLVVGQALTTFSENFDSVVPTALPAGWTSAATGSGIGWLTQTAVPDSPPNYAFTTDPNTTGSSTLTTPNIAITIPNARLTFRQFHAFTDAFFDGGVLEIKIGAGAFTDILAAGGSFVSGGYTGTLFNDPGCAGNANPIAGRAAWTDDSGGYFTTLVNLPAAAAGQTIQLRWRAGYDCTVGGTGWRIDNISIIGNATCASANCTGLVINSVIPPAGRVSGGQSIKLSGSFPNLSTVKMGGVSASFIFSNGTIEVTVTTPPHAAGAVNIDLTPTVGSPYSKSNAFAFLPTVFTDDSLMAQVTTAKAQHIIELRQAVDALRAVAGLGPAPWTDPTLSPFSTLIKAVHITELRSFLENAAALLGYTAGSYTDPALSSGFVIKRVHIEELRQRIRTIAG